MSVNQTSNYAKHGSMSRLFNNVYFLETLLRWRYPNLIKLLENNPPEIRFLGSMMLHLGPNWWVPKFYVQREKIWPNGKRTDAFVFIHIDAMMDEALKLGGSGQQITVKWTNKQPRRHWMGVELKSSLHFDRCHEIHNDMKHRGDRFHRGDNTLLIGRPYNINCEQEFLNSGIKVGYIGDIWPAWGKLNAAAA